MLDEALDLCRSETPTGDRKAAVPTENVSEQLLNIACRYELTERFIRTHPEDRRKWTGTFQCGKEIW